MTSFTSQRLSIRESRECKSIKGLAVLLLALSAVFAATSVHGQDYLSAAGNPTFSTTLPVEMGFINAGNGNLHIEIPLVSLPQRGSLPFWSKLVYDSRIWKITGGTWQPTNIANSQGGWRLMTSADTGNATWTATAVDNGCGDPGCTCIDTEYSNFAWTAPDGTKHTFWGINTMRDPRNCSGGSILTGDAMADDASGYHMFVTNYTSATVYAKDGTQVFPSIKDTNGNYFSKDVNGNPVDTLGRTAMVTTVNGNTTTYDLTNSRAGTSEYIVTTSTISVNTNFGQSGVTECSASCTITVITRIDLPLTGMSYIFDYDSGTTPGNFGLLKSITLPTGGTISYTYTTFADAYTNRNRWVNTRSVSGGQWTYSPQVITTCAQGGVNCKQKVTVTKPSSDQAVYTFTMNNGAWNTQTDLYNGSVAPANLLETLANSYDFSNNCPPSGCVGARYITKQRVITSLPTVGAATLNKKIEYSYDNPTYANIAHVQEWSFYTGAPPATPDRKTDIVYVTGSSYIAKNIINRPTSITVSTGSGTWLSQTNTLYDTTTLTPLSGIVHHDDTNFGVANTTRGNPTVSQGFVVTGATCPSINCPATTLMYDTTGQVVQTQDSNSNSTSIIYTDNFFTDNGQNPPAAFAPSGPTNAYPSAVTPPLIGTTSVGYYYYTGKQAYVRDQNSADTYFHHIDPLDRLTHTYGAQIATGRAWTFAQYTSATQQDIYESVGDTLPSVSCTSCRHRLMAFDAWGRAVSNSLSNDPDGAIITAKVFDTSGRIQSISHPYRTTDDTTYGLETNAYDGLNRLTTLTHQDGTSQTMFFGAAVSANGGIATRLCSGGASAYPMLSKDEAGKRLQTWTDGLGRTVEVDEPDSNNSLTIPTCNSYDLADNLTQVVQQSQTRTYVYDGLGRIAQTAVPETGPATSATGTTYFYYTTSGNSLCSGDPQLVCRRVDPRGITTTYAYDGLNRLTQKTYSDTTSAVKYGYDGVAPSGCTPPTLSITNPKGHRTSMCDGSGSTSWSYDAAGNLLTEKRKIGTVTKTISYQYNLDRSRTSITYPSGRVISYSYDAVGRPLSAVDVPNSINYVTAAHYTPHGKLTSLKNGATGSFGGITTSNSFNNRLEPAVISAATTSQTIFNLSYGYAPGANNGTVATIVNSLIASRTQSFTYDNTNRLLSAQSQATAGADCWGESFGYDAVGNLNTRTVTKCTAEPWGNPANGKNQIIGYCYDNSGNLTNTASCPATIYSYDAENQLTTASGLTYGYDGDNLRVKKSGGTLFWRGGGVDVLAETDLGGTIKNEVVYFAGRQTAMRDAQAGSVNYYFLDHLGSTRVATNANGIVCYDADYYPFGGEMIKTNNCAPESKFATYDRDPETGLDYAVYRHYSPAMGRFASVDRLNGMLSDPQSLNRYSYVSNRVLHFRDPLGLCQAHNGGGGEKGGQSPEDQLKQFAEDQLNKVGQSLTDCQAMTNIFSKAFELFGSTTSAAKALFSTLTELNPSNPEQMRPNAVSTTVGWAGGSQFGDTGFFPTFQDGSNQVRHFTGFFYMGVLSSQGGITGAFWAVAGRYRAENDTPKDRLLGIAGLDYGRAVGEGSISPKEATDYMKTSLCDTNVSK